MSTAHRSSAQLRALFNQPPTFRGETTLPAEVAEVLAHSDSIEVRVALAGAQGIPESVMPLLAEDVPAVATALALQPDIPGAVLEILLSRTETELQTQLLTRGDINISIADADIPMDSSIVAAALAQRVPLSPLMEERLIATGFPDVMRVLARNPSLSEDGIRKLLLLGDDQIDCFLLEYCALPQWVFEYWLEHRSESFLSQLAIRPDVPEDILSQLLEAPETLVLKAALSRQPIPEPALAHVGPSMSDFFRIEVIKNPSAPLPLVEQLLSTSDHCRLGLLPPDRQISHVTLRRLYKKFGIVPELVTYRHLPKTLATTMYRRTDSVFKGWLLALGTPPYTRVRRLLDSKNDFYHNELGQLCDVADLPADLLRLLVGRVKRGHFGLVCQANLSQDQLQVLWNESPEVFRQALALRPDLPGYLIECAAASSNWAVRHACVRNRACPANVLARLCRDEDVRVRQAVARHPNTPSAVLHKLAMDADTEVQLDVVRRVPQHATYTPVPNSVLLERENKRHPAPLPFPQPCVES